MRTKDKVRIKPIVMVIKVYKFIKGLTFSSLVKLQD
jgi:hypothetical protein